MVFVICIFVCVLCIFVCLVINVVFCVVFCQSVCFYFVKFIGGSFSNGFFYGFVGVGFFGGGVFYFYSNDSNVVFKLFVFKFEDYQKVYNEIVSCFEEKEDYDDGSYGFVFVCFVWYVSGIYDKEIGIGGSNGVIMCFFFESDYGVNVGFKVVCDFFEFVKGKLR